MSLITSWVLSSHSREACGGLHINLTANHACSWSRTSIGGNIPVTVCYTCALSTVLLLPLCYMYCSLMERDELAKPKL